ncbi:protein of unknown function [Eubacterium ruminantium]|nr:protein of unknown function [Eubacterium ruminantium]
MANTFLFNTYKNNRSGLADIWNAFMVENASFSKNDIPFCPTTTIDIPKRLIGFDEAKTIHKKMLRKDKNYHIEGFIHFYIDDSKFDGKRNSIWTFPQKALEVITHFDGIISPDFSTYGDFPSKLKGWNYYRMNAFGHWIGSLGISVISNVRWNTPDTIDYCFDGNPSNSMLALGSVASDLRYSINHSLFEEGLLHMIKILSPHTLIVYGSSKYPCFDKARQMGVKIVTFQSKTNEYYQRRKMI